MLRTIAPAALLLVLLCGCGSPTAEQHLHNAQARLADNELRAAVIELKNALQKAPDLAEARLLLGEARARLDDHRGAVQEFERALALELDDVRAERGLFRSKLHVGDYQEVIGALQGRDQLSPELAVILGRAYLADGNVEGARLMFQSGADLAEGRLGLALVAWQLGDAQTADRNFEQAVRLAPEVAEAWLRKGEFELSRQNLDRAEEAFATAVELPSGAVLGHLGLARTYLMRNDLATAGSNVARMLALAPEFPAAHYLDGLIRFEQGDLEGAESAIREVQSVAPDHGPSLYLLGTIQYRLGQLAQAEDTLRRYLAQDPGNESASKVLASVAFDRGDHEQVLRSLEPFAEATTDPQLLAMYGAAQLRLGHAAEATRALERAVNLAPDRAPFRNQLALSLLAAGDRFRAQAALESAIEVDGEQLQSDYLLALIHLRERKFDPAADAVAALIEKNPGSPIGYNLQGALALARGDQSRAHEAFERALDNDPSFLPATQNLAQLASQAGDADQATTHYQRFLEHNPGHEGALIALAEIALAQDEAEAAAGFLRRAVKVDAKAVRARLALARLELANNRVEAASTLVDEALERAPNLADLRLLRAEIDLHLGDDHGARQQVAQLQRRLAESPGNSALRLAVGQLQYRMGDLQTAEHHLERGLELTDGEDPDALHTLTRIALRQGDTTLARDRLTELRKVDDGETSKLLEADVLLAVGQRQQARQVLAALAEDGVRRAVMQLAGMDLREDDVDAAVRRLDIWTAANPNDLGAELLITDALMRQNQDAALARYEGLAETGNPVVLNNLAWLYNERNDPRAVDTARRAVEAAPDSAEALDTLGWALLQQGEDAEEAVEILRRGVGLNPDNPSMQYHLGMALRATGDLKGARRALTQAAGAGAFPEADAARRALAELSSS